MARSIAPALLFVAAAVLAMASCASAGDWDGWTEGRATFYGEDGGTTIHQGSCMLKLDYHKRTGFDIAAFADSMPEYPNSCGTCYEVACKIAHVKDGNGETLDRTATCHDEKRTVIVMISDTCPCYYPANAFSNKRWCCGDQPHMDLSTNAFGKIANRADGVAAIRYRRVACPTEPTYLQWDGDSPKQQQQEGQKDVQQQQQGGGRRMLSGGASARGASA